LDLCIPGIDRIDTRQHTSHQHRSEIVSTASQILANRTSPSAIDLVQAVVALLMGTKGARGEVRRQELLAAGFIRWDPTVDGSFARPAIAQDRDPFGWAERGCETSEAKEIF
jgi:hypothetical protein